MSEADYHLGLPYCRIHGTKKLSDDEVTHVRLQ